MLFQYILFLLGSPTEFFAIAFPPSTPWRHFAYIFLSLQSFCHVFPMFLLLCVCIFFSLRLVFIICVWLYRIHIANEWMVWGFECVSVLLYQMFHLSNGILCGRKGHDVKWIERSSNCTQNRYIDLLDGNNSVQHNIYSSTDKNKMKLKQSTYTKFGTHKTYIVRKMELRGTRLVQIQYENKCAMLRAIQFSGYIDIHSTGWTNNVNRWKKCEEE